jgi:hypothetical protein
LQQKFIRFLNCFAIFIFGNGIIYIEDTIVFIWRFKMAAERTLLLWSKSRERAVTESLWGSDRVIEVPDDVTYENMEEVGTRLSPVIFEEISKAKADNCPLRIVHLTGDSFSSVLLKVLEGNLLPTGGELLNLKIKKKKHDAPTVIVDDATAVDAILNEGVVDFDGDPIPDRPMFDDGLPSSVTPPRGWDANKQ